MLNSGWGSLQDWGLKPVLQFPVLHRDHNRPSAAGPRGSDGAGVEVSGGGTLTEILEEGRETAQLVRSLRLT